MPAPQQAAHAAGDAGAPKMPVTMASSATAHAPRQNTARRRGPPAIREPVHTAMSMGATTMTRFQGKGASAATLSGRVAQSHSVAARQNSQLDAARVASRPLARAAN